MSTKNTDHVDTHEETKQRALPQSHGLLQLPQSVASALATDFLNKREIRDLGVTCLWMLASLRSCWINEPISLPFALHRLDREIVVPAAEPPPQSKLPVAFSSSERSHKSINCTRVHNLLIGRFRNVKYLLQQSVMTENEVKQLSAVHRLVDCRWLTLHLSNKSSDDLKEKLPLYIPIVLPLRLQHLYVENLGLGKLISIGDFVLPQSLIRIEFESHSNSTIGCLSKLKWPDPPSQLKELIGMEVTSWLKQPISLPSGLSTVSFPRAFALSDATFPNSVIDLELPELHDQIGQYHEIVFPPFLKRLVLTGQIGKDDYDLNHWIHLPHSLTNVELRLRSDLGSLFDEDNDVDLASQPSSPIIITPWIRQFRLSRRVDPWTRSRQLPTLDLSRASSLISLVTDSLQQIQWPDGSLTRLQSLKPCVHGNELFPAVLRTHLHYLDLSAVETWSICMPPRTYLRNLNLLPNLTHLILPIDHKIELIDKKDPIHPMIPPFREAISNIFYQYATSLTDSPLITSEPRLTMCKSDMVHYILSCGAGETSASDERLAAIFTRYALPHGWINYDQLTVDGFCEFYRDACKDRMESVWSDLRMHGHRHPLIRNDFVSSLIGLSTELPNCLIAGRLLMDSSQLSSRKDDQFDCYQYVNGVQISHGYMTRMELERHHQAIFDLKPTELD